MTNVFNMSHMEGNSTFTVQEVSCDEWDFPQICNITVELQPCILANISHTVASATCYNKASAIIQILSQTENTQLNTILQLFKNMSNQAELIITLQQYRAHQEINYKMSFTLDTNKNIELNKYLNTILIKINEFEDRR